MGFDIALWVLLTLSSPYTTIPANEVQRDAYDESVAERRR